MRKLSTIVFLVLMLFSFTIATAEKAPTNLKDWEIREYTDEFDLPTGKHFISCATFGKFDNTIESNADLFMVFSYEKRDEDDEIICITLAEYGMNIVRNNSKNFRFYEISMLDKDNTKTKLQGVMLANDQAVCLMSNLKPSSDNPQIVLDALKKGGTLRFVLTERDHPSTKYKFSIDASNFSEVYKAYINNL